MFKIGAQVKTNDTYMTSCPWLKKTPLKEGIVIGVENIDNHNVIQVRTISGKKKRYNELFLIHI